MVKLWQALNSKGEVLLEHHDEAKVRKFWQEERAATRLDSVICYDDDIELIDLLARAAEDKSVEASEQEDAEYFKTSTVISGRVT